METVVYINNDEMKIIKGDRHKGFNILYSYTGRLEDESVLNSIVFNEAPLIAALDEISRKSKKLLKDCTLILDSSNIYTKKLAFPNLNRKQIDELIKSEFMTSDGSDAFLYDANIQYGKNQNKLLCCAVPRSIIENYYRIFTKSGIKIKRIDIAANGFIKLINSFQTLKNSTFAFNIISNENMMSLLFENGEYVFSIRSRLVELPGTEEYAAAIYTRLSGLVQFNVSKKSEFTITDSYYIGVNDTDIKNLKAFASDIAIAIAPVESLGLDYKTTEDFIYPLAGLYKDKHDINLLNAYANTLEKTKRITGREIKIALPILLGIVLAGVYGNLFLNNVLLTMRLNDAEAKVNSYSLNFTQYSGLDVQLNKLTEIRDALITNINNISELSVIDRSRFERILRTASPSLQFNNVSFDAEAKIISITGFATTEFDASDFVKRLKAADIFSDVLYTGYEYIDGKSAYQFTADCVFRSVSHD